MDAGWDDTDSDGEADIPHASAAAQALSAWFNEGEWTQPENNVMKMCIF